MMVLSSTLWFLSWLLVAHRSFLVSGCDHCISFGSPSFSPSTLVVRYGASASVTCTVCDGTCDKGLEKSLGSLRENDTTVEWVVENMTEWNPSPLCYYTDIHGNQCCSRLRVTVYQLPDDVSIRFVNHSGEMLEGQQYTLQCTVPNVAPVNNLTVTFYRGHEELEQIQPKRNQKTPVTETFTLNINTTKEDDGVQYWCEAKLQLGPDGPQHPPVASSKIINAVVHYKPQLQQPSHLHQISVKEGNPAATELLRGGKPQPHLHLETPARRKLPAQLQRQRFDRRIHGS
ncbi:intercellular adhesion molecule 2-like [Thalassophryne amazonica]|uniref:intercellular adhesion molecule 2-like n=1 Tax=Thalassophryne amazonica TaxID=390379 RepID=UPI0014722D4D|nr:intercellular adhesion molecule 2-like [Thalassophryne amazonica]